MNKWLLGVLGFVCGAAAGSVVTYFSMKDRNERRIHEEIDKFQQETLHDGIEQNPDTRAVKAVAKTIGETAKTMRDYNKILSRNSYTDYGSLTRKTEEKDAKAERPYVIPPTEFGGIDGYETITLTYFAGDKVLVDDSDYVVEDADAIVGKDSLTHFGEYEEDSVHVRNDVLKTDYEILRDEGRYSDYVKQRPYLTRTP